MPLLCRHPICCWLLLVKKKSDTATRCLHYSKYKQTVQRRLKHLAWNIIPKLKNTPKLTMVDFILSCRSESCERHLEIVCPGCKTPLWGDKKPRMRSEAQTREQQTLGPHSSNKLSSINHSWRSARICGNDGKLVKGWMFWLNLEKHSRLDAAQLLSRCV